MISWSKVYPINLDKPRLYVIVLNNFKRFVRGCLMYWNHSQVGHRSRYSVERLLSLRDYCTRTSPTRVSLVCAMSLIPAFAMATLIECIPLKPPDEGWKANYAFWVRLYLSSLPIAFGAVFQVKEMLEPGIISNTGIVVTGVGSSFCYVVLTIVIAVLWKFPIPSGYILTVAPFIFFYIVFFLLSIGPRVLAKSQALRQRIFSRMAVIAAQGVLAIAYPTFSAVFNQLSGDQQTAFIFVLPLIKFSVKQVITRASAHLHECVGLIVVFSVDVCNVLYVVVCMQTAISPITTIMMIALDAFFILIALRSIYYQMDASRELPKLQSVVSKQPDGAQYLQDLLGLIKTVFGEAGKSNSSPGLIRVRAPIALPISVESTQYMNDLVHAKRRNAQDFDSTKLSSVVSNSLESMNYSTTSSTCHPNKELDGAILNAALALVTTNDVSETRRIVQFKQETNSLTVGPHLPLTISSRTATHETEPRSKRMSIPRVFATSPSYNMAVQDVQDALQMLFHLEYVIMAEYIEFAIPVLYTVYLTFLYHLPTAAYYPHTRSLTPEKFAVTRSNLLLYSTLELASVAGVTVLLKRKFGFSPLYQLAFVLETQVATLQGHLFLWISVILQMALVHNGVDLEAPFK